MINRRSAVPFLAAGLFALGAAQSATAQQPLIFQVPVEDSVIENGCGFPIEKLTTGSAVIHIFPTDLFSPRVLITTNARMTFTNLLTGESISTPLVTTLIEQPQVDGTRIDSSNGLRWRLIVRGDGLIARDVGKLDLLLRFDANGNVVSAEPILSAGQQDGNLLGQLCTILGD